jgi:hypothetical protein
MGSVPFQQNTYPLGQPTFDCDRALALADSIEDEELIRRLALPNNL